MANVHRNISIRGLTDLLGRTRSGQNISTARRRYDDVPNDNGTELSHSDAMRKAATYARFASRHDLYLDRAAETGLTPYSIALTDWFGAPKVLQIDVDAWTGEVGQTIRVKARDNLSVAAVTVVIRDAQGDVLECGEALKRRQAAPGGITPQGHGSLQRRSPPSKPPPGTCPGTRIRSRYKSCENAFANLMLQTAHPMDGRFSIYSGPHPASPKYSK